MSFATSLAVAAVWAVAATALELALATWAPPRVWLLVGVVNLAIATAATGVIVAATRRLRAAARIAVFSTAVALSLAAVPANVRGPGPVVWVVCDTLRADFTSLYGYPRDTTPFLERWAGEVAVFDRAYSQASHTLITAPSLLASLYPSTHGLRRKRDVLDPRATLASEVFQDAGYETFGVFSNPHLNAGHGFAQGWDAFSAPRGWNDLSSEQLNRRFFQWRNRRTGSKPYFAVLWYIDPHTPFQWDPAAADWAGLDPSRTALERPAIKDETAPPELRRQTRVHYEAAVRTVDRSLERVIEFLRERGDYGDALILFTSDHGESLWDRGRYGHNYGLYDDLTRVPLLIRFPPPLHFPPIAPWTGRARTIASSVDLLPTTLDFLGLAGSDAMQGRSLLDDLAAGAGGSAYLEQRLREYGPYEIFGLREGRFKYIWIERFESDTEPRELLFDIEADPGETENLVASRPELAAALKARVEERRRAYESSALRVGRWKIDRRTREMLLQLGYVDEGDEPESRQ